MFHRITASYWGLKRGKQCSDLWLVVQCSGEFCFWLVQILGLGFKCIMMLQLYLIVCWCKILFISFNYLRKMIIHAFPNSKNSTWECFRNFQKEEHLVSLVLSESTDPQSESPVLKLERTSDWLCLWHHIYGNRHEYWQNLFKMGWILPLISFPGIEVAWPVDPSFLK